MDKNTGRQPLKLAWLSGNAYLSKFPLFLFVYFQVNSRDDWNAMPRCTFKCKPRVRTGIITEFQKILLEVEGISRALCADKRKLESLWPADICSTDIVHVNTIQHQNDGTWGRCFMERGLLHVQTDLSVEWEGQQKLSAKHVKREGSVSLGPFILLSGGLILGQMPGQEGRPFILGLSMFHLNATGMMAHCHSGSVAVKRGFPPSATVCTPGLHKQNVTER